MPTLAKAKLALVRGDLGSAERLLQGLTGSERDFLLGRLLAETGHWNDARPLLLASVSDDNHKEEAARILANGMMIHGEWSDAIEVIRELEQHLPMDPTIPKALAKCHLEIGNFAASMGAAQRALKARPHDGEVLALLSEAAEAAGRTAGPSRRPRRSPELGWRSR